MNNMRRGFTMIELIFVIVIIGILAAVAIPKLAATRDDAKISNVIANTRTALGDIKAYYTSQGNSVFKTKKVTDATSVPLYTAATCTTASIVTPATDIAPSTLYLCDSSPGVEIISFVIDENATSVTVAAVADDASNPVLHGVVLDPAIAGITGGADSEVAHQLGGVGVVR